MAPTEPRFASEGVSRVIKDLSSCEAMHTTFCDKVERNYRAWRGLLEQRSQAAQWTSKYHPPFIGHIVETTLAALLDERVRYRIRPLPKLVNSPEEAELLADGAKAHEILLGWQMALDRFSESQRPFALQNAIAGMTAAKVYWKTEEREKSYRRQELSRDPETGMPVPRFVTDKRKTTTYDGPCFEVRDVRDFFWHEAAPSFDRAKWVIDRCWYTYEELEKLQEAGVYKNVAKLKETRDQSDEFNTREQDLFNRDRAKDMIEVLEHWTDERVITVGNKNVLLRDIPNPFWHGKKPFVVVSTMPDLFGLIGISQVEKVEHLQEMLWTLMMQRLDNVQFLNNAIQLIRSDVEDPDAFVYAPGERWLVEDPAQVEMWAPNPVQAELSLGAEALIKGDMQNLAGGYPFVSGTESQTFDQQTATGASIVTNVAQRSLVMQKMQIAYGLERAGQMMMELNQQFVTEPTLAQIVGLDEETEIVQIEPMLLQGDYLFVIDAQADSLMRQERRAEAQAQLQMALQAAPVFFAAAQSGMAAPLNLNAFMEDYLDAHDILDPRRYFSAAPPPMQPMMPGGGQPQAPPGGPPQQEPLGVTAPQSIDPAVSPSNQVSMSPEVMQQRVMALTNGVQGGAG